MKPLPLFLIVNNTFTLIKARFRHFLRLAIPLIIFSAIMVLLGAFGFLDSTLVEPSAIRFSVTIMGMVIPVTSSSFILLILFVASIVMSIVGFHKTYLLNEDAISATRIFRFSADEFRFVGSYVVIVFVAIFISLFLMVLYLFLFNLYSGIPSSSGNELVFKAISTAIILYIVSRIIFIVPAAVISNPANIFWSWSLSKGNAINITLLVGLLPFLTTLLLDHMEQYLGGGLYNVVYIISWLMVCIIEIGFLSLTYKWLIENQGKEMEKWQKINQ